MTTEPSFITKPRPTGWTKPGIVNLPAPQQRPSKPPKPTKKPIVYERPPPPPTPTSTTSSSTTAAMQPQSQPKPKPKPKPTRPQVCKYSRIHPSPLFRPTQLSIPRARAMCDPLMSKAKQTSQRTSKRRGHLLLDQSSVSDSLPWGTFYCLHKDGRFVRPRRVSGVCVGIS